MDAETYKDTQKGGKTVPTFYWILVYIAILVAISLTVRWILIYLERRRNFKTDKNRRKKGNPKDGDD